MTQRKTSNVVCRFVPVDIDYIKFSSKSVLCIENGPAYIYRTSKKFRIASIDTVLLLSDLAIGFDRAAICYEVV